MGCASSVEGFRKHTAIAALASLDRDDLPRFGVSVRAIQRPRNAEFTEASLGHVMPSKGDNYKDIADAPLWKFCLRANLIDKGPLVGHLSKARP